MRNFMHSSAGLEEDFDGCAHAERQHRAARGLSKDNVPGISSQPCLMTRHSAACRGDEPAFTNNCSWLLVIHTVKPALLLLRS